MKTPLLLLSVLLLAPSGRAAFFDVPGFAELPPAIEIHSEQTEAGVKVSELSFAGAPFNGRPTRIYGFYCRPEKEGRYPAVLEIHGAGLMRLEPKAGIEYARNGFCCFVMDWAGPAPKRVEAGVPHSIYDKPETDLARTPPPGWKGFGPEQDARRNGVMFARRAAMFLQSRPEVDADRLCVSGMSAGAHLTLLILGAEPAFKVAAVKYGMGFIRDLPGCFGGYFGPLAISPKAEQDAWLACLDPKHDIGRFKANVLMLSGTDDIFFAMPAVLATHRAIPTQKRLLMFPNENHGYVGNVPIPLSWFRSNLGLAPAWPDLSQPIATNETGHTMLSVTTIGPGKAAKVSFWVKRMPRALFRWGRGDKARPETVAKWLEVPAQATGGTWSAKMPAPGPDEQVVLYATVTDETGVQASSDTLELPEDPKWRGAPAASPSPPAKTTARALGGGSLPFDGAAISRLSLDGRPRSLSIHQGADIWLGYDLERATLLKVWKATAGKPGLINDGFTTRSRGEAWFRDQSEEKWRLRRDDQAVELKVRYLGCTQQADGIELSWELRHASGMVKLVERVPMAAAAAAERVRRELRVEGLGAGEALLPPQPAREAWKSAAQLSGSGWHVLTLP
jgi:cephalosporin-C deacetylase-like acetyl esterase